MRTASASCSGSRTTVMPRPPPPATALISTGKPIAVGELERLGLAADRPVAAGHGRDAQLLGGGLGDDLVAHQPDVLGRGADEGEAVLLDHLGEVGVLGQEAVARMDRVGAGDLGRGQDRHRVQVAVGGLGRADADALVGEADMHGRGVGRGVDRDRGDAHLAAGAQDAQRDLAAIGDQDLVEHAHGAYSTISSGSPYSTGAALVAKIRATRPARGARIEFITFIASMISSVWPSLTRSPTLTNGAAPGSGSR